MANINVHTDNDKKYKILLLKIVWKDAGVFSVLQPCMN